MFVWWTDIWFVTGKSWFQEEADEALSQNSYENWAIAGCLFQATSWSGKHVHGRFQMSKSGSEQLLPRRRQAWETQLSCFPHSPKLCSNLCNFLNFEWQVNFSSKTFAIQLFKALTSYRHPPNMLPLLLSIYATPKACNRLLQKPRTQGAKCSAFTKHRKLGSLFEGWLFESSPGYYVGGGSVILSYPVLQFAMISGNDPKRRPYFGGLMWLVWMPNQIALCKFWKCLFCKAVAIHHGFWGGNPWYNFQCIEIQDVSPGFQWIICLFDPFWRDCLVIFSEKLATVDRRCDALV